MISGVISGPQQVWIISGSIFRIRETIVSGSGPILEFVLDFQWLHVFVSVYKKVVHMMFMVGSFSVYVGLQGDVHDPHWAPEAGLGMPFFLKWDKIKE